MSPAAALTDQQLAALRALDGCAVANAIETFEIRLRNEGFANAGLRSLFPELPPMVGYAATVRIRGSVPPAAGARFPDRSDWWSYIASVPAPRVVVIEDAAETPGREALIGEVHMNVLRALGCIGVVTNGGVRDLPAARAAGFHYFAGNVALSHGYVHIVEFGQAVVVDGLAVPSGELLHGDQHGVQSVPLAVATRIPAAAAALAAREREVIALCRSADFGIERLRLLIERQQR